MKDTTRARVAAAVGAAVLRKNVTSVYDYSSGGYKSISASVGNGSLNGYDYTTSSYFTGSSGTSLDFYDYHSSKHVLLNLKNGSFDGYDYDSGSTSAVRSMGTRFRCMTTKRANTTTMLFDSRRRFQRMSRSGLTRRAMTQPSKAVQNTHVST